MYERAIKSFVAFSNVSGIAALSMTFIIDKPALWAKNNEEVRIALFGEEMLKQPSLIFLYKLSQNSIKLFLY